MEKENLNLGSFLFGIIVGGALTYYLVKIYSNSNEQKKNSKLEKIGKIVDSTLENK